MTSRDLSPTIRGVTSDAVVKGLSQAFNTADAITQSALICLITDLNVVRRMQAAINAPRLSALTSQASGEGE